MHRPRSIVHPARATPRPTRPNRGRPAPLPASRRLRPGFTLTELLVALLLLDVGVLALVASGAAVVRELAAGTSKAIAIEAAQTRLERLAALACPLEATGSAPIAPSAREWWSATTRQAVRELADSAEWLERGTRRALVLRTRVPC